MNKPSTDGLTGPEVSGLKLQCLGCDAKIQRSATVGAGIHDVPKPGDFAVCKHCGEVMRWTSRMLLRGLNEDERSVALRHPAIRALSVAARTRAES